MRPALALIPILAALPLLGGLAGCTTAPASGSPRIQTSSQANRENIEGAMAAPMRDLNVLRTKIPNVLLDALEDPYKRPQPMTCAKITAQLLPLNGALGADLDEPSMDQDDLVHMGQDSALGAVAGAASGLIPFRGWVRKLSGAEKHDSLVAQAITAGAVRRGYLKGLGESHNCAPPAVPSHVPIPRDNLPERDTSQPKGKPRYPIR
jgi:stage V sporulation protein SpoVS